MTKNLLLLKDKSILFAEDDSLTKEYMCEILSMIFSKVFIAEDGAAAYKFYTDESPDIVLTDLKMPNIDGIKLINKIRANDYRTPIILLTSFVEQELLWDATNLSIDGYLVKPIELNKLIDTLCKAMQRIDKERKQIPLGDNLYYNSSTQELYDNGVIIELGIKERIFLELMVENPQRTLTKEEISKTLWPLDPICDSAITNLILRVRKKLPINIILSVRGIGYRLNTHNTGE